jgi:lipoate-protein ligase A
MSFTEILAELPILTFAQRQELMVRVLEIDEPQISPEVEAMLEERLAEHDRDPSSALTHEEFKSRLQALLEK